MRDQQEKQKAKQEKDKVEVRWQEIKKGEQ